MLNSAHAAGGLLKRIYSSMTLLLLYVGDLVIDSTGPLRRIRLPDGLYVVGERMLIAVDSEEEAEEIIEELKSQYGLHCRPNLSESHSGFARREAGRTGMALLTLQEE